MEESDKNKIKKEKKVGWKKKFWNIMNINRERKKKLAKKNIQGHFGQLMLVSFSP